MKKQTYRNLFKAMLLPVIVLLTVLWVSTGVVAGELDEIRTLTLNFNDKIESYTVETVHPNTGVVDTVTVKDAGGDGVETLDIVYDSAVTVTVNPVTGYWPTSAECTGGEHAPELQGKKFIWSNYDASYSLSVSCTEREYKVIAQNLDGSTGELTYLIDDEGWTLGLAALSDGTLTYQKGRIPLTELPVVKLQNHTFEGWNIVVGNTVMPISVSGDGNYYIPSDLTIVKAFDEDGVIRVCPILKPVTYEAYREDRIYDNTVSGNRGTLLLKPSVSATVTTGTYISAIELDSTWCEWADDVNGYRVYPGYTLLDDASKYAPHRVGKPTENNEKYNTVVRFYLPITYTLVYYDDDGELLASYDTASEYVYGNKTAIAPPTRNGWTFDGWTVQVYKDGKWQTVTAKTAPDFAFGAESDVTFADGVRNDPNAIYASDAQENGAYEIRLVANWTPNTYTITYDWNVPAALLDAVASANAGLVADRGAFTFAQGDLVIGKAVRTGYVLAGWELTWTKDGQAVTVTADALAELFNAETGELTLKTGDYYSDITLKAQWKAKTFDVLLDPAEGTAGTVDKLVGAVDYDAQLVIDPDLAASIIPARRGYTFLGFFSADGVQYIGADGSAVSGVLWAEDSAGTEITLYAHWQVNFYNIAINVSGVTDEVVLDGVEIKVTTADGEKILAIGEEYAIAYGTAFTVQITSPDGYKTVWWSESGSVAHTASYTASLTCDWIEARTFEVRILPVQTLDVTVEGNVDYRGEEITGLTNGKYVLYIEGNPENVTVSNGKITISDAWFGKSVTLVLCGNGTDHSDSEPCVLALAARPAAPDEKRTQNPDGEIEQIRVRDDEIVITMVAGYEGLFEFAIRERGSQAPLVWQSNGRFDADIQAGTWYEIYVRRAATDTSPHGEAFSRDEITTHSAYIQEKKDELDSLLDEHSGDIAKQLIADKKAEIDALAEKDILDEDFYEQIEAIVASVRESELALANKKDATLVLLDDVLAECLARGFYSDEKYGELMGYYDTATEAIKNADDQSTVTALYEAARQSMQAVPMRAVIDADRLILLESILGLDQESVLTLIRNSDIEDISRAIAEAIRTSGKVAVGDFTTQEKAEQLLRELDVVAYYKFDLIGSETVKNGDVFTITLQIPKDLRGKTGLQVAYYNEETGVIELLETKVSADGKTLTFTTTRVADFVILADPTVNLFGVIAALGGVLLLQLIALALILSSRSKNKKNVMHASLALPAAFLTVHFAPVGGEVIALALAGAVIVMQIILMILLLRSDAIYKPKRREDDESDAYPTESGYGDATAPAEDAQTDAEENTADADMAFMAAFTYGAATETDVTEDEDEGVSEEDPFALYEEEITEEEEAEEYGEAYGEYAEDTDDGDFIEPAPFAAFDEEFEESYAEDAQSEDELTQLGEGFAQLGDELDAQTYAEDGDEEVDAIFEDGYEEIDEGDLYAENPDALFEELYAETGDLYEENPDALYEELAQEDVEEPVADEAYVYEDEAVEEEIVLEDDTDPMYRYDE
ncbi:MAG: hypothetical protein IJW29_01510 [Clostridia bacterium]|nr:hypothetical protein [Clostridia bacterium]